MNQYYSERNSGFDSKYDATIARVVLILLVVFIVYLCAYYYSLKQKQDKQRLQSVTMILTPRVSAEKAVIIQTLVRQASRWANAAQQDTSPLIATLHGNYGEAYLSALESIATDSEIEAVTGINVLDFQNRISKIQDQVTLNMAQQCPNFAKNIDLQLAAMGGE